MKGSPDHNEVQASCGDAALVFSKGSSEQCRKTQSPNSDELTITYDLHPTETGAKINEVCIVHQAQKSFTTEIRQHLYLDADEQERRWFLTWLEEECARAEGEESDEMV